jgi:hypothetical protein
MSEVGHKHYILLQINQLIKNAYVTDGAEACPEGRTKGRGRQTTDPRQKDNIIQKIIWYFVRMDVLKTVNGLPSQ